MRTLQISMLFFLLLLCSCATVLKPVPNDFTPTDKQCIVFGKSEVIYDGKVVTYAAGAPGEKLTVLHHVSKYDINNPPANEFVAGEFMFKALPADKGYFAFMVPPGKYYFHEFIYPGLTSGVGSTLAFARTYLNLPHYELKKRSVIIFEVEPNSATYVGTIQHHCDTVYSNVFGSKYRFSFDVTDDLDAAKTWFTSNRSGLENLTHKGISEMRSLE